MSINPNVGGDVAASVPDCARKPGYYHFKKWYREAAGALPWQDRSSIELSHDVKDGAEKVPVAEQHAV